MIMSSQNIQFCAILFLYHLKWICAQCENGDVRIAGGPNQFEGRVELCVSSNWRQVCAMGWAGSDAQVVCHQLGFTGNNAFQITDVSLYGGHNDIIAVTEVQCNGNEQKLGECRAAQLFGSNTTLCSGYSGHAGVGCQDTLCVSDSTSVRLSEDQVVEVCAANSGYRTVVCSNNWDDRDASVICRQLGLGEIGAYQNVNCAGTEEKLSDCAHGTIASTYPLNQCSTGRFAQVQCEGVSTTITEITTTKITTTELTTRELTTRELTTRELTTTELTTTESSTTGSDDLDSTVDMTTTGTSITPEDTTEPSSAQLNQSNSLLTIVLGAVGGLIALLLFAIVLLLIFSLLGRKGRRFNLQNARNGRGASNQVEMQRNEIHSISNLEDTTAIYEEIDPPELRSGRQVDVFDIKANAAYQTNTSVMNQNNGTAEHQTEEFFTEVNESYQSSAGWR